jgi:hypothetical protein
MGCQRDPRCGRDDVHSGWFVATSDGLVMGTDDKLPNDVDEKKGQAKE